MKSPPPEDEVFLLGAYGRVGKTLWFRFLPIDWYTNESSLPVFTVNVHEISHAAELLTDIQVSQEQSISFEGDFAEVTDSGLCFLGAEGRAVEVEGKSIDFEYQSYIEIDLRHLFIDCVRNTHHLLSRLEREGLANGWTRDDREDRERIIANASDGISRLEKIGHLASAANLINFSLEVKDRIGEYRLLAEKLRPRD